MSSTLLRSLIVASFMASLACGRTPFDLGVTASGTETDADTATGDGGVSTSDGDPSTTGDGDPECVIATEGCPCTGGGSCDPGLMCEDGICVCAIATEGCPCTGGGGCEPGLSCEDGICVCVIATEGCPCTGGGACDPGLSCEAGLCVPIGGDGDPGDGDPTGDGDGDPVPTCGNGIPEAGEECDDGNMSDTDACLTGCIAATCGDGFVWAGVEECDDANMNDSDECSNTCEVNDPALSCKDILDGDPNAPDGVYLIDPDGAGISAPRLILCDMTTDGGGWTMVASTSQLTLNDQAGVYHDELQTFNPANVHTGVWGGMRPLINANSDIRFTCIVDAANQNSPTVDLSFYDIIWYREITTGSDNQSCFSQQNGAGDDQPPPARRNNLTNQFLMVGDQWNADGYLEGEDFCGDNDDFTVDFDDRGMDSDESDGTDWGEDDNVRKCGVAGINDGAWHIWVREP